MSKTSNTVSTNRQYRPLEKIADKSIRAMTVSAAAAVVMMMYNQMMTTRGFTVVSQIVTFPDGFFPKRRFPERRFPDGHFPG